MSFCADTIKKSFGERFREACADSGLKDTQDDLAKVFDVSGVMIWSYRNGEKIPRMARAIHIAKVLDVSVEWLLTGRGSKCVSAQDDAETMLLNSFRRSPEVLKDAILRFIGTAHPQQHTERKS
jgi:transcriptional regulator with XRE-family HTH domain